MVLFLRRNSLLPLRHLNVRRHLRQPDVAAVERRRRLCGAEDEVHWEALHIRLARMYERRKSTTLTDLEGVRSVNLIDVLLRQLDLQRVDVALEVRRLAPADNGEDVRRLVHHVCQPVICQ